MWKQSKSRQSGFTLVELAIVLVIIGLILAAVLKGQEMIQNAKVKSLINDLRSVSAAYYSYQDRYKAIPGDDAAASTHFTGGINGNGNGIITGTYTDAASPPTTESNLFWQHTRLSGFLTGEATATLANPPNNALGGLLGVQGGTSAAQVYGMTGSVVCAGNIPWKIALAVDTVIDDGDSATGDVRSGSQSANANNATATTAATIYGSAVPATATLEAGISTLCMKI